MVIKREKMKAKMDEEDEDDKTQNPVILLSSSDDEGNEDLSLAIVKRAEMREVVKRKQQRDGGGGGGEELEKGSSIKKESEKGSRSEDVISLSSSEEVEVVAGNSGGAGGVKAPESQHFVVKTKKKKSSKSKKKKKSSSSSSNLDEGKAEQGEEEKEKPFKFVEEEDLVEIAKPVEKEVIGAVETEEMVSNAKPMETEAPELPDNTVMRKLLRVPRYFDPPNSSWAEKTCFNCGEEGHMAVNCTMEKRKKPCFVCGSLEHGPRQCKQGQECFICNKGGHRAKNCPEKHQKSSQISNICLRCGDLGHTMFSCTSDYAPEDLKEIQCYICKRFGHLCCVDFIDSGSREISCYNCGLSGHAGMGCAKVRGETNGAGSSNQSNLCFKCGEEGHFSRGCTKYVKPKKRMDLFSTPPAQHFSRGTRDSYEPRSLPHDTNKARQKKHIQYEERGFTTPSKAKNKRGWTTDDYSDPYGNARASAWRSPTTPTQKPYINSRSPSKKSKHYHGTPNSQRPATSYHHTHYASRFGHSNDGSWGRGYGW